ncbi:MAG: PepSY domain-containing protein [Caldilineaceae bacterium]|nr:PepSY domain-containing protein [Caldilineaceae bacterium]
MKSKVFVGAAAAGLLLSGLGTTAFIGHAQTTNPPTPAGATQQEESDTTQDPSYKGSIAVDEKATDGMNEADEAAALQGQAKISQADAEAAAIAANPGATVVKSELDNENGSLVYSVELSNGVEVIVDAGNGAILATEQDDDGSEVDEANENEQAEANDTDTDDVQEEHDGQPGNANANEAPGTEDAAGK